MERYDRQMLIYGWGREGQKRLKRARITVVGAGGLGCPASLYLTTAGVGRLVIVDQEKYELSNLNRQVLGWEGDLGRYKVEVAAEKLRNLNSNVGIEPVVAEISEENARGLVRGTTVVIDATDNWRTRFILNGACVEERVPLVHAGIYGFHGQVTTILPGKGPCLSCILPKVPAEVERFPVVGVIPGLFAMFEVMEALKLILGVGEPLVGRMLMFDGEDMSFHVVEIKRRPDCRVCGEV